jgi:hypothetical protein
VKAAILIAWAGAALAVLGAVADNTILILAGLVAIGLTALTLLLFYK